MYNTWTCFRNVTAVLWNDFGNKPSQALTLNIQVLKFLSIIKICVNHGDCQTGIQ